MKNLVRIPRVAYCLAAGCVIAAGMQPAYAGCSCEAKVLNVDTFQQGMDLAHRTAQALGAQHAQHGNKVVLLARAGQGLSRYGLKYSHLGWAYEKPLGAWCVAHQLNECGTAQGHIDRQGVGEFFLDDLWRPVAAVQVPNPQLQQPLWTFLTQSDTVLRMQHKPYSMVSYAGSQRYQQSNQWAIESLAAAMETVEIQRREQAPAWLQFKGYEPSALTVRSWTRLGGRITAANTAFDDHPNEKRFASRIETVSVDSVSQWLQRKGMADALFTIE